MSNRNNGGADNGKTLLIAFLVLAVLGVGVFAYRILSRDDDVPRQAETGLVQPDQNAAPNEEAGIETVPADQNVVVGDKNGTPQNGATVPETGATGQAVESGAPPPDNN